MPLSAVTRNSQALTAGTNDKAALSGVINRFVVDVAALSEWAVPNDSSIFDKLDQYAIDQDLAKRIMSEWKAIRSNWSTLPASQRQTVNQTVQKFEHGGITKGQTIPEVIGDTWGAIGDWKQLAIRLAVGLGGGALVAIGAFMISSDITISAAANKFGKAIGGVVKRA